MTAFPEPTEKRYAANKLSLGKGVVQFLFKSAHSGTSAADWEQCYKWCRDTALEKGWTSITQSKTRVFFEVNKDLNFKRSMEK